MYFWLGSHGKNKVVSGKCPSKQTMNLPNVQLQIVRDDKEINEAPKNNDGTCSWMEFVNYVFFGKSLKEVNENAESQVYRLSGVNANKLLQILGERTALGMQVNAKSIQHLINELNNDIKLVDRSDAFKKETHENVENKKAFERTCKKVEETSNLDKTKIGVEDFIDKGKCRSNESEDNVDKSSSVEKDVVKTENMTEDEEENVVIKAADSFVSLLEEETEDIDDDDEDEDEDEDVNNMDKDDDGDDFETSAITDSDYDDLGDEETDEDQDYHDFILENDLFEIKNLEDDIDDEENDSEEEIEEDDDEIIIDDPDLLDEEKLDSKLKEKDHFVDKVEVLEDLIDILGVKINDRDNHVKKQAMRSLVVYSDAMEELKKEVPNDNTKQRNQFLSTKNKLDNIRRNSMGKATMFEEFADKAWEVFEMYSNESIYKLRRSEMTELTNDFIFNYHYANELMKVILDGDNLEERNMVEESEEDMIQMGNLFKVLGLAPHTDFEDDDNDEDDDEEDDEDEEYDEDEEDSEDSDSEELEEDSIDIREMEDLYTKGKEHKTPSQDCKTHEDIKSEQNNVAGNEEEKEDYQKRKLLSVDSEVNNEAEVNPNGHCSQDDPACDKDYKSEFTNMPKTTTMKPQKTFIQRCTELLESTNKHVESAQKHKFDLKNLEPKRKLILLRKYMNARLTEKKLVDEHQKIAKTIKDANDKAVCQPMLKAAILGLYQIQQETDDYNLMGELMSLLHSSDPEVTDEVSEMMEKMAKFVNV